MISLKERGYRNKWQHVTRGTVMAWSNEKTGYENPLKATTMKIKMILLNVAIRNVEETWITIHINFLNPYTPHSNFWVVSIWS